MLYALVTLCLFSNPDMCVTFKLLEETGKSTQYFATKEECIAGLTEERRNRMGMTTMLHYGLNPVVGITPYGLQQGCIPEYREEEIDRKFRKQNPSLHPTSMPKGELA